MISAGGTRLSDVQAQWKALIQLLSERKALLEIGLSTAATAMFILSVVFPWWSISTNIGAAWAPLWSSQPLQGWSSGVSVIRPDWYLILPVAVAALVSLLLTGASWKESVPLYFAAFILAPLELFSARALLVNYFFDYLHAVSDPTNNYGAGGGYFTGTPGAGIILFMGAYVALTLLCASKVLMKDSIPLGKLEIVSIMVIFSGFYWYLIGSTAFPANPSWIWVMTLDTAFIECTGVLLWSTRRNGWLSPLNGWKERLQLCFLPALVLIDALTTNYAIPATGASSPLISSGASVRDASVLVNTVQSSGVPQVAYLFWTLLTLQVLALSYLTLGLSTNVRLRSFPRFLASYALYMMIAAYAFTVSNNALLIFTGRTWFANSEALVLVIGVAVALAFLLSVSTVWGLGRLSELKKDWGVHF